jgi:hypothetical protein
MNYNSITEFGKKEDGCYFFTICPEKICLKENGSIEKKCLMMEREIYHELFIESQELDYLDEENRI